MHSPQHRLPSMLARMRFRITLLVLVASLPLVLWSVLPVGSSADQTPGQIQKQDRSQQLADRRPQGQGAGADQRHLQPDEPHQRRCRPTSRGSPRASRSCRRASTPSARELAAVQSKLRQERARLTRLRARLLVVRRALAARLVELYKADAPDAITVVLESEGFADLLTRTEFMERVSRQDAKIMDIVADGQGRRRPRPPSAWTRSRSARPASPRRSSPSATRSRRVRVSLVDRRDRVQTARSAKTALLASSRDRRHELEDDVATPASRRRPRSRPSWPASAAPPPPGRSSPARAA